MNRAMNCAMNRAMRRAMSPAVVFLLGLATLMLAPSAATAQTAVRVATGASTHELAAQSQRPRVTIHRRKTTLSPNAKRQCRSWLVQEYRVSGTVIVPKMQCWWE